MNLPRLWSRKKSTGVSRQETETTMVNARAERSSVDDGSGQEAVRAYVAAIAAVHRPAFDRLHRLIHETRLDAIAGMSYGMLCYRVGDRRLFVGVWKHGLSIYGWPQGREVEFTARHPQLKTSKGTIRLPPDTATDVTDDELRALIRAALAD
jgi:uncharacterized protein YdhG (YjbR/CyaY superfamily)